MEFFVTIAYKFRKKSAQFAVAERTLQLNGVFEKPLATKGVTGIFFW
jgi:hypothetical protein